MALLKIKSIFYQVIKGDFTRPLLLKYIIINSIIFMGLILVSYFCYPPADHFSILTHTISYLGAFERNPQGWIFLSLAFVVMGVSFIPVILFIHRRIVLIQPFLTRIGSILSLIGSVSTIIVGFLPDVHGQDFIQDLSLGRIHNLMAISAFVGISGGFTCYGIIFLLNYYPRLNKNHRNLYPHIQSLPVFIIFAVLGLGTLVMQYLRVQLGYPWPGPGLFSFPLWEWALTLYFVVAFYWITLSLPVVLPSTGMDPGTIKNNP